ncbi:MAG: hypothetical protein IT372_20775 [Polyangiaceae bacterium]|nr:hypothetical protein [Polyangiaceae bacterium]
MSSDRDRDDPKDDLLQGLGLLWRAARKTATVIRKDLDRSNVGKAIDDAGRELVRAATNVVGFIGSELKKVQPPEPDYADRREDEAPPDGGPPPEERNRPVDQRPPAGPTPEDPGFRIAVDDEGDGERKPR